MATKLGSTARRVKSLKSSTLFLDHPELQDFRLLMTETIDESLKMYVLSSKEKPYKYYNVSLRNDGAYRLLELPRVEV